MRACITPEHTIEEPEEHEECETQSPGQMLDERNLNGKQGCRDEHHDSYSEAGENLVCS